MKKYILFFLLALIAASVSGQTVVTIMADTLSGEVVSPAPVEDRLLAIEAVTESDLKTGTEISAMIEAYEYYAPDVVTLPSAPPAEFIEIGGAGDGAGMVKMWENLNSVWVYLYPYDGVIYQHDSTDETALWGFDGEWKGTLNETERDSIIAEFADDTLYAQFDTTGSIIADHDLVRLTIGNDTASGVIRLRDQFGTDSYLYSSNGTLKASYADTAHPLCTYDGSGDAKWVGSINDTEAARIAGIAPGYQTPYVVTFATSVTLDPANGKYQTLTMNGIDSCTINVETKVGTANRGEIELTIVMNGADESTDVLFHASVVDGSPTLNDTLNRLRFSSWASESVWTVSDAP
jgi:hypothetical protein